MVCIMDCHLLNEEGMQELLLGLPNDNDTERDPLENNIKVIKEEKDLTEYEFGSREFAISFPPIPLKDEDEEDEGEEEEEEDGGGELILIKDEEASNENSDVPETVLIECDVNEISDNVQFIDNKLTLVVEESKPFENDSVNQIIVSDYFSLVDEKITKTYFACKICKLGFETESEFLKHSEIHFPCHLCQKVFLECDQLERHINMSHTENVLRCSKCPEVFPSAKGLYEHEQSHIKAKEKCHVCGKMFKCFRYLSAHLKTHEGVKSHICNVCNESFANSTNLKRHIVKHTGLKPFTCGTCNKGFRLPEYLQRHMQRHSRADIPKPFKCDVCGKRFSRSIYLHEHFSIHTGDRPFKCQVCTVTYRHSSSLRRHMESHHGESTPT